MVKNDMGSITKMGMEEIINGNVGPKEKDRLVKTLELVKLYGEANEKFLTHLRKSALAISYFSIVMTVILGIATFVIAALENSAASFGFAINALLDCGTSAVVIWRYQSKDKMFSPERERGACLCLAVLFLLSFGSTFAKSLHDLIDHDQPSSNPVLWIIALTNAVICMFLAIVKFYLGYELDSKPLISDGLSSFLGFVLASGIVIETKIYEENKKIWYLDCSFGILCSLILLAYSIKLFYDLYKKKKAAKQDEFDSSSSDMSYIEIDGD